MAPQNSTLIHENTELTSELSRYSPILALNDKDDVEDEKWAINELQKGEKSNDIHRKKSIANSNNHNNNKAYSDSNSNSSIGINIQVIVECYTKHHQQQQQ